MTTASDRLAKAQEVAALKGLRAAVPFYVEATDALAGERRYDAAVGVLAEVLNAREKKRGLFGSKEVNPLGPDRTVIAKQFARMARGGQINDSLLELLSAIAAEHPDDPDIRLANAEGLYRAGYMADAIDEYRYCEKLIPDDGALVARLGELYGIMSRNAEAVDHLRKGIGDLMQAHHFDDVVFFSHKLIDLSPQAANDVQRWLSSLPDEALQHQRSELAGLLETIRDNGLDDGRWATLEQRLASLPAEINADGSTLVEPEEHADEPAPVWGSKTGNVALGRTAWDDVSSIEPASEDEMRMLLGPHTPEPEAKAVAQPADASSEPAPAASAPVVSQPQPVTANNGTPSAAGIGKSQAPSGAALPPGLAAFTRRKAEAAFTAGDFAAAASSYERLIKAGFDAEIAAPLLECYLGTERFADAGPLALQLAEHQAEAGELDKAVATLALVLEHTDDADVERRHAELLAAK